MDVALSRRLAMLTWGPLVATFAIGFLQLLGGARETLFGAAVASVGELPVSVAMGVTLVVGAIALVHSDIGDPAV